MTDDINAADIAVVLKDAEVKLDRGGAPEDIIAICEAALAKTPGLYDAIRVLVLARMARHEYAAVLRLLMPIEDQLQDDCEAQSALAIAKKIVMTAEDSLPHWRQAIRLRPARMRLRVYLAEELVACYRYDEAISELEPVLSVSPDNVGALMFLGQAQIGLGRTEEGLGNLRRAADVDPTDIQALQFLVKAFERLGRNDEAIKAAREAVHRTPDQLQARALLIEQLIKTGRHDEAASAQEEADPIIVSHMVEKPWFSGKSQPRVSIERPRVALFSDIGNCIIATDFIIDPMKHESETIFIVDNFDYPIENIEKSFDVIFQCVADVKLAPRSIEIGTKLLANISLPVINHTAYIAETLRELTGAKLGDIPNVYIPRTEIFSRADLLESHASLLAHFSFPVLIRPAGSHVGRGLQKVDDMAGIAAALDQIEAPELYVTEYCDFASDDGLYRKFRMIYIDNEAYPVHLATSEHWLNHYFRTRSAKDEAFRCEEERFLERPDLYLGDTLYEAVRQIGKVFPLEYYGLDFTIKDGKIMVFECNPMMLVLSRKYPIVPHKLPAARRVQSAVDALLVKKANPPKD